MVDAVDAIRHFHTISDFFNGTDPNKTSGHPMLYFRARLSALWTLNLTLLATTERAAGTRHAVNVQCLQEVRGVASNQSIIVKVASAGKRKQRRSAVRRACGVSMGYSGGERTCAGLRNRPARHRRKQLAQSSCCGTCKRGRVLRQAWFEFVRGPAAAHMGSRHAWS